MIFYVFKTWWIINDLRIQNPNVFPVPVLKITYSVWNEFAGVWPCLDSFPKGVSKLWNPGKTGIFPHHVMKLNVLSRMSLVIEFKRSFFSFFVTPFELLNLLRISLSWISWFWSLTRSGVCRFKSILCFSIVILICWLALRITDTENSESTEMKEEFMFTWITDRWDASNRWKITQHCA